MTTSGDIRWGLIGASDIAARALIPALRENGSHISAVSSGNGEWAREYAKEHAIAYATDSFEDLVTRDDVDAVYVSSTNEKHHAQVLAAARAGKHVLCEKPLATSLAHAIEMALACEDAGVVMATNHHMPASSAHQTIKRLVADGAIGDVLGMRVMFAVQLTERLRTWRLKNPEAGAGAVLDLAVHSISVVRNAIGGQAKSVMSINTIQGDLGSVVEDASMAVMDWDGNALVETHETFTVPVAPRDVHVIGSEATIIGTGVMGGNDGDVFLMTRNGTQQIDVGPIENFYVTTVRKFEAAVAGEGEPLVSGRDGVATLAVALAELESAATGTRVIVPRPFD